MELLMDQSKLVEATGLFLKLPMISFYFMHYWVAYIGKKNKLPSTNEMILQQERGTDENTGRIFMQE